MALAPQGRLRSSSLISLDHLVGEREQLIRHFEPKRFGGFEVDDEFELVYLFNRQVSGVDALKNSTSVNAAFVIAITEHRSIAHQAADFDVLADFVKRRNCMTRRKRDKALAPAVEQWVSTNKKRIRPLLDKRREDLIKVIFAYCTQDTQLESKRVCRGLRVPR